MDTYLVATQPLLPFDVPVATFIQSFPWGPVIYIFEAINYTAGYVQVAVGVAAVLILFLVERRAGYLMAIGSISSGLDNLIKLACCARVWAGSHWRSDVAGGFLLGLGWSAFVVWLPERWLPSPSWKRFTARRRRVTS